MTRRIRIGAVSYLNTRPLVFGFEQGLLADRVELSFDIPSTLARRMTAGELDVALLPTIELARIPDLEIVPGLSIASRGPARSVLLISKCPPEKARSVALDPESRTSNALTRVLFDEAWKTTPDFEIGGLDLDESLRSFDAVLRIGDKALFEPLPEGTTAHDLGETWTAASGKPFVYAVWAARPGVVDRELYRAFHESRREGGRAIDAIADDYTWEGRQYPELSREYLTENIRFRLGSDEVEAMRRFLAAAARLGLTDGVPPLELALTRGTSCDDPALALRASAGEDR
ncbi:MAG: menaquinone biosynthesis protein [Acidobacteriota bacterium]|nr:menaquinone biosynthesis protein [Acidobacteriota bacterium]